MALPHRGMLIVWSRRYQRTKAFYTIQKQVKIAFSLVPFFMKSWGGVGMSVRPRGKRERGPWERGGPGDQNKKRLTKPSRYSWAQAVAGEVLPCLPWSRAESLGQQWTEMGPVLVL